MHKFKFDSMELMSTPVKRLKIRRERSMNWETLWVTAVFVSWFLIQLVIYYHA